MRNHLSPKLLTIFLILMAASALDGQSGRRMPKTGPPPVSTPSLPPDYVPPPAPPAPRPTPEFTVKVVDDIDRMSTPMLGTPQKIHSWILDRLHATTLLNVRDLGAANRSAAVKLAKAETEAFVALLEIQNDPFSSYSRASVRSMMLIVTIYHPHSGKVKLSRTIPIGQNAGRTVIQTCSPGVYGDDVLLLLASIEAADTILNSFSLPAPPACR